MATQAGIQMNTRLDGTLKTQGEATLASFGMTSSEAVRSLWRFLSTHKTLPDFMLEEADATHPRPGSQNAAAGGAGLAVRIANDAGMHLDFSGQTYDDLREGAFEEYLLEHPALDR